MAFLRAERLLLARALYEVSMDTADWNGEAFPRLRTGSKPWRGERTTLRFAFTFAAI